MTCKLLLDLRDRDHHCLTSISSGLRTRTGTSGDFMIFSCTARFWAEGIRQNQQHGLSVCRINLENTLFHTIISSSVCKRTIKHLQDTTVGMGKRIFIFCQLLHIQLATITEIQAGVFSLLANVRLKCIMLHYLPFLFNDKYIDCQVSHLQNVYICDEYMEFEET